MEHRPFTYQHYQRLLARLRNPLWDSRLFHLTHDRLDADWEALPATVFCRFLNAIARRLLGSFAIHYSRQEILQLLRQAFDMRARSLLEPTEAEPLLRTLEQLWQWNEQIAHDESHKFSHLLLSQILYCLSAGDEEIPGLMSPQEGLLGYLRLEWKEESPPGFQWEQLLLRGILTENEDLLSFASSKRLSSSKYAELWHQLRGLLSSPSPEHWESLTRLLQFWPASSRELAVEYAHCHLCEWPLALRTIPIGWLEGLLGGSPEPMLFLTTACNLDSLGMDGMALSHLAQVEELRHIEVLSLNHNQLTETDLALGKIGRAFPKLRELSLLNNQLTLHPESFLLDPESFPNLHHINLDAIVHPLPLQPAESLYEPIPAGKFDDEHTRRQADKDPHLVSEWMPCEDEDPELYIPPIHWTQEKQDLFYPMDKPYIPEEDRLFMTMYYGEDAEKDSPG